MKRTLLLKNVFTYGLGQILSRCLSLLLLPFLTGYLTVQDYGIISILSLIVTFAGSLLTLGLRTSFSVCYADNSLDEAKVISTSFFMILLCSLFGLLAWWKWAPAVSSYFFGSDAYTDVVRLTYLSTVFNVLAVPFTLYMQFKHQATRVMIISVIFTLSTLFLNIMGIIILNMGVRGQVWASLLSNALLLLMYWISLQFQLQYKLSWTAAKVLLKHGLLIIPASFSLFFLQNSQRYFLDQYSTLAEVGLYTVAFNIGSVANLLVSSFSAAWTPFFLDYQDRQIEAQTLFSKIFTYYTYFFGTLALAFFVFADPVVKLMTQPPFHPSASIIGIIATGWIVMGYYNLMNPGMVFAKKVYINSFIQFAIMGLAWIGNTWCIPYYGKMGAALIFLGAHLAMVFIENCCNHFFGFFRASLEWKRFLSFGLVLASLIIMTYSLPLRSWWEETLWGCCALLIATGWCLFNLTPNEWVRLWKKDSWTIGSRTVVGSQ
jgi:O-antigen/teichoic acid export membrane protein